jgi:RNA polymerase sigma-70 factor (ECF subfamily)
MQTDPDVELMLRFKAGDQQAFRRLFDNHKGRVIQYCYRFCGHQAVAEELAQETFIRVYKAAARYRPKARFMTWLFKIATNVCLNELRRPDYHQRFVVLSLSSSSDNHDPVSLRMPALADDNRPDEHLAAEEQQRIVMTAITKLPHNERAALLLRVKEEFSYQEIGQQIGCSENRIKTLIYRGRSKLKKALAAYFGEKS